MQFFLGGKPIDLKTADFEYLNLHELLQEIIEPVLVPIIKKVLAEDAARQEHLIKTE